MSRMTYDREVAGQGSIGLRERKKLMTRQALEEAALRLFATRGFEDVTVEDVADAVGVSSRTFFRYFSSKEDAVLGPFLELHEVLRGALAERLQDEPVLDALRHAAEDVARRLEELRPRLRLRVRIILATPTLVARAHEVREAWRRALVEAAATRLGADPTTDLRPHLAAAWVMAGLSAARDLWESGATARDLPSLLTEAYDLLSGDLAAALAEANGRKLPPEGESG
jgi:AcrR family transcriptional regulator